MRPNNAAIASSFAQLGRKEVPVGFQPFPFKTAPRKGFLPVGSHFFLPRMNDGGFQNGGSVKVAATKEQGSKDGKTLFSLVKTLKGYTSV